MKKNFFLKYWLFGLSSEHKKRKFQLNRKFIDITAPRSPSIKRGTKRFPFSFIFNTMTSHFFHVRLVRFSLFYVCYLLAAKTNKINKKIDKKIIGYDFNQLFLFLLSFSKSYGICLLWISPSRRITVWKRLFFQVRDSLSSYISFNIYIYFVK